jgi:hypothetical protein
MRYLAGDDELMASYWPTLEALATDPIVAGIMNQTPKIVFFKHAIKS